MLEHTGIGDDDSLNRTPVAQQLRERIDKWDHMKLKSFCTAKEPVTRLKRHSAEWKKIFASYTSDKGLISRICRELRKLNSQRINNPMKKWANELNRAFPKEVVQVAKKTHEERFNIPGHKGNGNQNHLIPPHSWQNGYNLEHKQAGAPVIPATQEAEIRRITVQSQSGQIVRMTLF
jgi:uncharacterized protein YPO0396